MSLRLAATEYGGGAAPPVAILHGLFGSARNWATIARRLGAGRRVVALDLRNHGHSPWAARMDYPLMADDVVTTLRALGLSRCALIGHSMGGKVAMVAALQHAGAVERLIVVDIAPIAYASHHLGHVRAMRGLDLGAIRRRVDADRALRAAVPDAAERGFLLQNLVLDPLPDPSPQAAEGWRFDPPPQAAEGRVGVQARWRLNLAAIEEGMPELAGFPAPAEVYRGPVLFVAGGRSDYLLPAQEPTIRRLFPAARIARIADAGHWLHAERPQEFLAIVEPFLAG